MELRYALAWECQEDVDDLRKKIKDDDNTDRWSRKQREEVLKARKDLGLGDILD